ncbi:hypothetical protein OH779_07115 [Actinacidiphila glaucinigra]|uniref:hypothetical protein n=1 Tax=Actinacidiphila glaucinigra TaxID=235986 RepID=UPI00386DBEB2
MDSYVGAATLEWWANRSTCLGWFDVRIEVGVTGSVWSCSATLADPLHGDRKEVFDFLMALDPVFTLRFDARSSLLVDVALAGDGARLVLTAHAAEESAGSGQLWDQDVSTA